MEETENESKCFPLQGKVTRVMLWPRCGMEVHCGSREKKTAET